MDLTELAALLDEAGVAPDDHDLPGRPSTSPPPREGALFVAEDEGRWLVGGLDRGRHVVALQLPDEDSARRAALHRLTARVPAPRELAPEERAEAWRRTEHLARGLAGLLTDGPQEVELPAGVLLDRFGADHGRWLFPATTPFPQRSLPPDLLDPLRPELGRRVFLLESPLQVLAGIVVPWFEQPGGGVRLDLRGEADVRDLLRLGVLSLLPAQA